MQVPRMPPKEAAEEEQTARDPRFAAGSAYDGAPSQEETEMLVSALLSAIEDSLCMCMFSNAIFHAERLYELQPTYRHLQILATCHCRGGGAATACRLLLAHYPFFEVHVTRPGSAGGGVGGRPRHDFSPSNASLLAMRRSSPFTTTTASHTTAVGGGVSSLSTDDSPLGVGLRSALRRGDRGEAIHTHEPVDLAARWDCQYVLGVCCTQTGRYTEGTKVLEELLRVCARLQTEAPTRTTEDTPTAARCRQTQLWRSLGSATAGHPAFYVDRVPEVQHLLGVCAERQHMDAGPDLQRSAFHAKPLLFCAFESYVQGAWRPSREECLGPYNAAAPASSSPTPRVEERAPDDQGRHAQEATHVLRRFLRPYATASFLVHTFRSKEAQRALQPVNFPGIAPTPRDAVIVPGSSGNRTGGGSGEAIASPWCLSLSALARFHYGDMLGSAAAFQALLAAAPWRLNDPALMYYSTALWQLRAEGDLGALAQRLTEEMPLSPITLVVLANTYSLAKESKDAVAMLDRAVQMEPGAAYAHALRGYELLSLGMTKEARDAFNKAVNTDRNMYSAYAGLGELAVREERLDNARQYFKQAIALNPLPTIMNRYAATYHRPGAYREDLEAALAIYAEAIRHHPQNLSARHQSAEVLLAFGKASAAEAAVTALIEQHPNEAMLYLTLARCKEALADVRSAVAAYHRAMTLDPRREPFIRGCLEKLSAAAGGEGGAGHTG